MRCQQAIDVLTDAQVGLALTNVFERMVEGLVPVTIGTFLASLFRQFNCIQQLFCLLFPHVDRCEHLTAHTPSLMPVLWFVLHSAQR